nr:NifU family protein [Fannyhessea vaginae]
MEETYDSQFSSYTEGFKSDDFKDLEQSSDNEYNVAADAAARTRALAADEAAERTRATDVKDDASEHTHDTQAAADTQASAETQAAAADSSPDISPEAQHELDNFQAHETSSEKPAHVPINREILEATLDVIRESLQADGGDIVLVNVSDDGVVTLDMVGACAGCPMSAYDMSEGVERILKEHVPGVVKVEPSMMW